MFGDLNGEPRYTASELLQPVTDEERQLSEQLYDAEQCENHCERQVRRFERLSEFSFDEDNRRAYGARLKLWETRDKEALFDIDETKKKIKEVQEKAKKPKTSHLLRSGALPRFVNYSFDSDDEKKSENSTPESVENSGESGIIYTEGMLAIRNAFANAATSDEVVDAIINNHKALADFTPETMKQMLTELGYDVKPLGSRSSLKGLPFEEGGGYRVSFGGDGYFQYHPETGSHHENEAYWRVSNGKKGDNRYDLAGNKLKSREKITN